MNTILKQRLIGALILVALGVVFWPIIFVQPGQGPGSASTPIPAPPRVDTTPIATPDQAGLRQAPAAQVQSAARAEEDAAMALASPEEAAEDSTEPLPAASIPPPEAEESPAAEEVEPVVAATRPAREAPPEKPQIDAQGVPVAWILQVASVSSRDKANGLRDTLVAQQHKAFVKQVKRGDRTLYRVYVGPKFEKAQLESIKPAIDSAHGVNSIITRYVP